MERRRWVILTLPIAGIARFAHMRRGGRGEILT